MDDKRCWIGENADSKYNEYGISGLCQKTNKGIYYGLSEHDTMRVYMKDDNGNNPRQWNDTKKISQKLTLYIAVNVLRNTYWQVAIMPLKLKKKYMYINWT